MPPRHALLLCAAMQLIERRTQCGEGIRLLLPYEAATQGLQGRPLTTQLRDHFLGEQSPHLLDLMMSLKGRRDRVQQLSRLLAYGVLLLRLRRPVRLTRQGDLPDTDRYANAGQDDADRFEYPGHLFFDRY